MEHSRRCNHLQDPHRRCRQAMDLATKKIKSITLGQVPCKIDNTLGANDTGRPNVHWETAWETAVHTAAGRCSFRPNADEFMRDKFLYKVNESFSRFREDIYRDGQRKAEDPPFTIAFVVSQALSFEAAQQTNKLLAHCSIEEQVHYATSTTPARNFQRPPRKPVSKSCFFCGGKAPHPREKCPAQGQTCSYCHKLGHFSNICQQAIRDQRLPKKPLTLTPRREHVRMVDLDQSFALPSADGMQYKHCFTISDMSPHTANSSSTVPNKGLTRPKGPGCQPHHPNSLSN